MAHQIYNQQTSIKIQQKHLFSMQSLYTQTHTHTHPFNGPLSRTTRVSRYQKGKPILILLKQQTVSGSGIRWAICKSAPRSRQITKPHHTTQFFIGLSCHPTNSIKALTGLECNKINSYIRQSYQSITWLWCWAAKLTAVKM